MSSPLLERLCVLYECPRSDIAEGLKLADALVADCIAAEDPKLLRMAERAREKLVRRSIAPIEPVAVYVDRPITEADAAPIFRRHGLRPGRLIRRAMRSTGHRPARAGRARRPCARPRRRSGSVTSGDPPGDPEPGERPADVEDDPTGGAR